MSCQTFSYSHRVPKPIKVLEGFRKMPRLLPSLSVVWMHTGARHHERRDEVRQMDYPDFELIEVQPDQTQQPSMASPSDLCVFWADDDAPVGPDFLQLMVRPVLDAHPVPVAHYWEGNALCLPRQFLSTRRENGPREVRLLRHLMAALDSSKERLQVVVSPAEKLAPLLAPPVGVTS